MVKRGISILLIAILTLSTISFASAVSEFNLTYDGNGNLVTGDGKYREYNEFNQLIRVYEGNDTNGDILETYVYHPTEDRILIKFNEYEGTSSPDGAVVYINDNFDRKYDISGVPTSNDTYYAKDESGIVGEVKNGTKAFYHNDHLGSTSALTNSSGALTEETFYAPYGEIIGGRPTAYSTSSGGVSTRPIGLPMEGDGQSRYYYEGKEFSLLTDDYDFNFRKYDPELGIFTQPEQTFPDVYDPQQLNKYSFERRNPYKYVDPTGEYIETAIDIAFITYDIKQISEDPEDVLNYVVLGADIVGAILPGVTFLGVAVKGGGKAVKSIDKAGDVISVAEKAKIFGETGKISKEAERVLKEYGNKIIPYSKASRLTKGLKGEIQAHHLVEARHLISQVSKLKSPAILLSKQQHNLITNILRKELPYGVKYGTSQITKTYKKVYGGSKGILKSIKKFLGAKK